MLQNIFNMKQSPLSFRFSEETKTKLKKIAEKEGRSITNMVERLIDEKYNKLVKKENKTTDTKE